MKVLFAVNNESVSEAIVKKYQRQFKEIISYKNVYYFNAILKEIQKDKTYDRIVISEDLEQFTNSSYEQMDKFIFERLDSISDEASNLKGEDIPIILICTDRRSKSEQILIKLFGIGIYNAIIGNDRSVDEVCRLINKPRLKKDAKAYYKIDSEEVNYKPESENDVSEVEIQNIIAHFKRIGKNEEKYLESFKNIAEQYNDTQLRLISKVLPLGVRAVLEEKSPEYQKVMSFNKSVSSNLRENKKAKTEAEAGTSVKLLESKRNKKPLTSPIVIPSEISPSNHVKKISVAKPKQVPLTQQSVPQKVNNIQAQQPKEPVISKLEPIPEIEIPKFETTEQKQARQEEQESVVKRGRGRPRKNPLPEEVEEPVVKRGRGRPRKNPLPEEAEEPVVKRGRGRPRKNPLPEDIQKQNIVSSNSNQDSLLEPVSLEDFEELEDINLEPINNEENVATLPGLDVNYNEEPVEVDYEDDEEELEDDFSMLPGLSESNNDSYEEDDNYEEEPEEDEYDEQEEEDLEDFIMPQVENQIPDMQVEEPSYNRPTNQIVSPQREQNNQEYVPSIDLSSLLQGNQKIITFVGTTKNGTSFIVNNLAQLLSESGVNVAILDTTQNRNSYYIYTKNEEELRKQAMSCIPNLAQGTASGIKVNNNLTVYTSLPNEDQGIEKVQEVLQTLIKNHTIILIDCDFYTPKGYFSEAQETYLVQSMDILTIQPLTAFLKDLIAKNILEEQKIRIIINKYVKMRGVSEKEIIGGMAYYNDPAMTFMTGLFDRNLVKHITIPFEEEIYVKYLYGIVNCEISLKGYSKAFMQSLKQLSNMIYPLLSNKGTYKPPTSDYNKKNNTNFSNSMNNTLNKMKRKY